MKVCGIINCTAFADSYSYRLLCINVNVKKMSLEIANYDFKENHEHSNEEINY